MDIRHPLWLLAAVPFICLLFFLAKERKRVKAVRILFKQPHLADRFILRTKKPLWLLSSLLAVYALASPMIELEKPPTFSVQSRTMVLSVDCSTSMGSGPDSAMEKIKKLTREFAKKRHSAGDFVGITAYSGIQNASRGGAAIIVPPTRDWSSIEGSISILRSQLLGSYTAIGEGIWVSLKAILKDLVYDNKLDFESARLSLDTVGTEKENVLYLLELANKTGAQKDKVIVLFTDGYYNSGIDPAKPLWLAKRLGIRVHFVAFLATGQTGLTKEEAENRKARLAQSVVATGGKYFESSDIAKVAEFYNEIDRIEKGKITIKSEYSTEEDYERYIWLAFILFSMFIVSEGRMKI